MPSLRRILYGTLCIELVFFIFFCAKISFTRLRRYLRNFFSSTKFLKISFVEGMCLFKNCCTLFQTLSLLFLIIQNLGITKHITLVLATILLLLKCSPMLKQALSCSSQTCNQYELEISIFHLHKIIVR